MNKAQQFISTLRPKMFKSRLKNNLELAGQFNGGCFLICGGPALNDMNLELFKLPGIMTMSVNNAFFVVRTNMHLTVDTPHRFAEKSWRDPTVMKFVNGSGKSGKPITRRFKPDKWIPSKTTVGDCQNIVYFQGNTHFNHKTWWSEPSANWGNEGQRGGGRSCMLAALKILYVLGFKRIYLCGASFHMSETDKYAFDEQRNKGAIKNNNYTYLRLVSYWTRLQDEMVARDFRIYQCTPKSHLYMFPFISLENAIKVERADFPDQEDSYGKYLDDDISKIEPSVLAELRKRHAKR